MIFIKVKFKNIEDVNHFVDVCEQFPFDIDAKVNHYIVDAKSLLGIIALGLQNEFEIIPHADNLSDNLNMVNTIKVFSIQKK